VKQEDFEKVQSNPHMSIIGHITDEKDGIYFIDKSGSAITLRAQGWKHF
jgi:thiamine-monophosphate kinase